MNRIYTVVTPAYRSGPTGLMRWNGNSSQVEVMCDPGGSAWAPLPDHVHVDAYVSPETEEIFKWVEKKMAEETELSALCAAYPGIKDMQDKLAMMIALVKQETAKDAK